ncbi:hypothetical protein [Paludisphaera soli]|uniref:hypothetical protein n=1 Tax=Paludisphaera soli TaxID=2712865 RepID=UPI0013EBC3FB|nr:hypothetical protein [Paludisphaera soli]
MPHRLFHLPFAQILAVMGAAITGVCTFIGSTVQQGHALLASAVETPVAGGWYFGLFMAIGAAIVSVYQGISKTRASERLSMQAEILELTRKVGVLQGSLDTAKAELDRVKGTAVTAASAAHAVKTRVRNIESEIGIEPRTDFDTPVSGDLAPLTPEPES